MKEYIEKQAALEAVSAPDIALDNHGYVNNRKAINAIPVADVRENVRGEWIDITMWHDEYFWNKCQAPAQKCSNCGEWSVGINKKFCSNCGADMRGEA